MSGKYKLSEQLKEKNTTVSEDQKSSGVTGNIRSAVIHTNKYAYDKYFDLVKKAEESPEKDIIPLNSSFGSENAKNGRVISFNVAGSSFAQPLRYEKGLAGKSNVWLYDEMAEETVHVKEGSENHIYSFTNQDGSVDYMYGDEVKEHADKLLKEVFGEPNVLGLKEIRVKESEDKRKVKYSISGPRVSFYNKNKKTGKIEKDEDFGLLNQGDYKIDKTAGYICQLGEQQLEKLAYDRDFIRSGEHIHFTFTGHSRGGCGVIEGAMKLKGVIKEKYPGLADRIHFEALLYDPVPGPKVRITSNINHGINLKEQTKEMAEENMLPFDENDHCTVMYSMGCNNKKGFTPMKVMGADTIILTGHSHDEGLKDVEEQFGLTRRKAYINSENGEAYRASGLAGMPKGIYISDENNVMVKADNMTMVEDVINEVYTRPDKAENARIRRITEACTDLAVRSGGVPTEDTIIRGFNAHDPKYVISSSEFRAMKKQFMHLDQLMKAEVKDPEEIVEERLKLRELALGYISSKNGKGPHSNRTHGRLDVAKNIVRYLDSKNAKDMNWVAKETPEDYEKINDVREAYISSVSAGLQQNIGFMEGLCEDYKKGKTVETDMFKQTITSMMAARYFQKHQEHFMPHPLTDTKEKPAVLNKLDALLGEDKNSIYDVMGKSDAVNRFAENLLKGGPELSLFKDPEAVINKLDMLGHAVEREYAAKVEKKAPVQKTERIAEPVYGGPSL